MVMAKELLGLYYQSPINGIIGSEVPLTIPFVSPANGEKLGINLEGIFDLVEKDDVIVEFKTSGQTMDAKDAEESLQLTVYGYAYEALCHRPPRLLRLIDFVKTKKPKMVPLDTKGAERLPETLLSCQRGSERH